MRSGREKRLLWTIISGSIAGLLLVWVSTKMTSRDGERPHGSQPTKLASFLERCNLGDVSVLEDIKEDRSLLDSMDGSGWNCLINASKNNRVSLVQQLLRIGASTGTASVQHSALRGAALSGYDQVVHELIKAGANVDVYSAHQRTALMGAAMNGHRVVVEILLEAGANRNLKNDEGMTAKDLALMKGHNDIADMLS